MKKIFLILAVLMLAAPAFGDIVTITAAQVSDTKEVTISYGTNGQLPRAFALDITVDNSQTITDVGNFFVGECNDSNGYGIFPASFNRHINADFNNWDDANYTPVADVNDLPGDTEGGIGTGGITIEMGSLYAAPKGPPETSGILCSIWVSGDCNVGFSVNAGRAGVVMEDGNDANSSPHSLALIGGPPVLVICTVPDVEGDTNAVAQAAISVDFTIGDITTACSDTIADGNVISTDPAAFTTPGCGTDVNILVSTGQPTVPNVLDMNEADAIAAINAVAYISAGTPTYECNDTIADGNVISTTPGAGPASCGTTVAIVLSGHPDYAQWVTVGTPDCWCDAWQCRGDADGTGQGIGGKYRVSTYDNEVYRAAYNKSTADFGAKTWADVNVFDVDPSCTPAVASVLLICADVDHAGQGIGGKLRVSTNDTPFFRSGALGGNNNVASLPKCPGARVN